VERGEDRRGARRRGPFAALLSGAYTPSAGERVGVVVCGGNSTAVDFGRA
jgi:hypothetical protein